MSEFALKTDLPGYLRREQLRIEALARSYGLDMFPMVFEILSYDQMNEIAAYEGFPNRYPHWRFGMEYERLSKSYTYGLSKIYEMVINNNPSYAYLLEGNSLVDQKMVMAHVCGHVDFFKNNLTFRRTDLDGGRTPSLAQGSEYQPDRRWVDRMANHGALVRRHAGRHGVSKVEEFVDACLSLENLIDPFASLSAAPESAQPELSLEPEPPPELPRLRSKEYMDSFINPSEFLHAQRERLQREAERAKRFPESPQRDVLAFLLEHAPLERYEHDILSVLREEALYFMPQRQTKILNEGWATYWHSKLMTEHLLEGDEIVDFAENASAVLRTSGGQLNPYKLGYELLRSIEQRWDRGQFGPEWDACDDLAERRTWDRRVGLGRQKLFEVRALCNDIAFLDEFLTPDFVIEQKLFTFGWSERRDRFEIESREFRAIKQKLLFGLMNAGQPYIYVLDANYENRGELFLRHEHQGLDLRVDYAKEVLQALQRVWKRPVQIETVLEGQHQVLRFDGHHHSQRTGRAA